MKKIILLAVILAGCSDNTPTTLQLMEHYRNEMASYPPGSKGHADASRKFDSLVKWEDEHTGLKGLRLKQKEDSLKNK